MKKDSFINLVCILIGTIFSNLIIAQNTPATQVTIASPTAASLGKYADMPVNYNTGTPQIDIPIYTLKSGPLSLPISLSYHASGLKVMESASWVGAGWALNAGGVITRSVAGAPDDRGVNASHTTYGHFHDYGYNNYLFSSGGTNNCAGFPGCPVGADYPADDYGIADGIKDGEPDVYFFNFGGYSGKFYFRDDRTPVLVPQQDLKIEPILANENGTVSYIFMLGFVVTTLDGTKYYFGKNQNNDGNIDAIEQTFSINTHTYNITGQTNVSSWFLTKIVSADNQFSIDLTYVSEKSSYYTLSMFPIWNIDNVNQFNNPYGNYEYDLAKNFINGVRLSQIKSPNATITFEAGSLRTDLGAYDSWSLADNANTEARTLGSISITDNNGFCKKHNFYYSYFFDGTSPMNGFVPTSFPAFANIQTDKYRLCLDSIKEMSCANTIILPPCKFDYYLSGSTKFAPRKLTFGQDHWGFYNGATTNNTLVPEYRLNRIPQAGADRDAHWPAMEYGTLKKITYPTGGSSVFDFESHDTYGSQLIYNNIQQLSMSAGYTITSTIQISSYTFSDNLYLISLQNGNRNFDGSLAIKNESGQTVKSFTVVKNGSYSEWFSLVPGTYTLELHMPDFDGSSGHGIYATLVESIPTTIQGNIMVGGLRIKTITKIDGVTSNNIVSSYNYNVSGGTQSSGILYSRPNYVAVIRNDILKNTGNPTVGSNCSINGCASCDASTAFSYFKSGGSIIPMKTVQGNHIGYGEVNVSQTNNGYSRYRFYQSDIWNTINSDIVGRSLNNTFCDINFANYPYAPVPIEYKRGEIQYEGHFNQAGHLLKEVYYYPTYTLDPATTPGYIAINSGGYANVLWGTEYELQSYRKSQMKTISYEIDPVTGNDVSNTTTEYYESPFHNQPTRKVTTNSKGENLSNNTKYAFDYRIAACDNIDDGWQAYLAAYNSAYATYLSGQSCVSSDNINCKWMVYQQWRYDKSVARKNYVEYRKTNFTDADNAYKRAHDNAKEGADAELKPILELQDENNNPQIEVTSWKNANLTAATFTKYDHSINPATGVHPKTIQKINLASPSASFASSGNSSTAITKDSRYANESSIKFYKGNLVELLPKNGIYTSYIWGPDNNFPIVKAIGVDQNTLQNAYDAVSGNLSLLRGQATIANAHVFTYTYSPLVGMTSQTDPNGRTTYYEYDALGRLNLIRDQDNNIIKKICYNYAGQQEQCGSLYQSDAINGDYYSQNCSSGQSPVAYHVSVPQGMFTSSVDQLTANQQAQQYAQNQANQYGTCETLNVSVYGENNSGTDITIQLHNVASGQDYWFTAYAHNSYILGDVPPGNYNITLTPNSPSGWYNYSVGCSYYSDGPDAITFYGVDLNSSCSSILID